MKDAQKHEARVCLAWICRSDTKSRFTFCVLDMIEYDLQRAVNAQRQPMIRQRVNLMSGPRIAEARSQIVDVFGAMEDCDWLLMLDDDMTFDPDLLDRLLEVAHPTKAPVVGGLCFAGVAGGRVYPTLYRSYNEDDGHWAVEPVSTYPRDDVVRVGATGAACLLVHKTVFHAMRRPGPAAGEEFDPDRHGFGTLANGAPNPYPWFEEGRKTLNGVQLGEDIVFCRKLGLLGVPIFVNTAAKLGHIKEWVITEEAFDAYHAETERPDDATIAAAIAAVPAGPERDRLAQYLAPRPGVYDPENDPFRMTAVVPAEPAPQPTLRDALASVA